MNTSGECGILFGASGTPNIKDDIHIEEFTTANESRKILEEKHITKAWQHLKG
jgi:hypothetical protein